MVQPKQTSCFYNNESIINKGVSIDTIKLTLRHYKHSNPAEAVNIFIYHFFSKCMSDALIRAFGRWRSNAFLRYIRAPSISQTCRWVPCAYNL